jgi:hypothetical protein
MIMERINLKTGMERVETVQATQHQTNPIAPRWTFRVRTIDPQMLTPEQNDAIFGFSIRVFRIKEAEAGFRSLTEAIDTTTAPGRMMMQMVGAFAEYAEPAVMRSRELDPVQNTARFLTVSNVMSVWRAMHNPGPFSQERSRPAQTGCAPGSGQTVQSLLRTSPQSLKR